MTWFAVDDQAHDAEQFRDPDLAAVGLWTLAGSWSAGQKTDGFVPETVLRRWGATKKQADWLVSRKAWKTGKKGREVGWWFVDWSKNQPEKADTTTPIGRARWARKNALTKNRALCDAVVERDGGLCRYCGIEPKWTDRSGPRGATYDHVDPRLLDGPRFTKANSLENVVVACRRCNGRKKDRTPEEAGMTLLAPGTTAGDLVEQSRGGVDSGADAGGGASLETVRSQVGAGSAPGPEPGPGRVGAGPGPTSSNGRVPT